MLSLYAWSAIPSCYLRFGYDSSVLPLLLACVQSDSAAPVHDSPDDSGEEGVPSIVIIGGGPAGMAVAGALSSGLLLEAADVLGGRADRDNLTITFVDTPLQAASGIEDDPEQALARWADMTGGPPTDMTAAWLEASPEIYDRLVSMGVGFSTLSPDPITHVARLHEVSLEGSRITAALQEAIPAGVEVRTGTWVDGLALEDGRVVGVEIGDETIAADAVVIATGGFSGDSSVIEAITGGDPSFWPGESASGNGQALAWADQYGLGTDCEACVGWRWGRLGSPLAEQGLEVNLPPENAPWVWVNREGHRFVDETQNWSITLGSAWEAQNGPVALISAADMAGLIAGEAVDPDDAASWLPAEVLCADSLEALGELIAIDAKDMTDLRARLANADSEGTERPLQDPPDLESGGACAVQPGRIALKTFGGLAVDDDGRVLDLGGEPVPGLYAAGEAAGMLAPGWAGTNGVDGSLSAVVWSGWRLGALLAAGDR